MMICRHGIELDRCGLCNREASMVLLQLRELYPDDLPPDLELAELSAVAQIRALIDHDCNSEPVVPAVVAILRPFLREFPPERLERIFCLLEALRVIG